MSETVSQIPKERIDELFKVVALVGAHRKRLVIPSLLSQSGL
jgi:hypothetical protein